MWKRMAVVALTGWTLALVGSTGSEVYAEPTKRALLIGIDEYESDEISDLAGCANDVDLMKSVLIGKFDFAPDDVLALKDEAATRTGIIEAIRSHLGQSESGDIAFVHYSGHGSQMPDRSGDEADGWDETIVPHDSRGGEVFDISDDEINGLMRELSAKTPHVVFVMDSCHSGTAARAVLAGNVPRKAPADERTPPDPEPWALGARGFEEAADGIRLPGSNYVLISGCRANELSNEASFDGARHGAMTYYLARALRAAGIDTTYRDVMEQVKANVSARFASQHPQLEGTGTETMVFGAEEVLSKPYVLVEPTGGAATDGAGLDGAIVHAGKVLGVRAGQEFAVFPKGTKSFEPETSRTGKVRVTRVKDFTAEATILEGAVGAQSRAELDAVGPPAFRAGVYLDDVASSALLRAIVDELSTDDSVVIVDTPVDADMRVTAETEGTERRVVIRGRELEQLSVATPSTEPELDLACDGRMVPSSFRATQGATGDRVIQEKAIAQIKHWARWFRLLAIDNPSGGDLPMDFRIERADSAEGDVAPETMAPGDSVRIVVANESKQPAYLTLLDFWSNGRVCVQHPGALPEPLEPGEAWEVTLEAAVPQDRNEGVDILKAFLTTEPLPSSVFALGAAPRDASSPDSPGPLEQYLARYGRGQRALVSSLKTAGWSTQTRVLRVEHAGVENRGFVAHYASAEAASRSTESLSRSGGGDRSTGIFAGDPTMVEYSTAATRGETPGSVGKIFQDAYDFRDRACAADPEGCPVRVEPLLELELDRSQSAPLEEDEELASRGGGGEDHLEVAKQDTVWSHKYTRVPAAWDLLRASGRRAGEEAAGVVIAHPDTGYLPHPEIWEPTSERPILEDLGWDYFDGDSEPIDATEKKRLLDNPVHGTGSSSAIISKPGCQLPGADDCPTGIAQGAKLVPLRVNSSVINFSGKRLAQALLDASVDGPDAVRPRIKVDSDLAAIAMGGPPSWALWKATRTAEQRGFLVIAAAGNYVRTVVWPARYDSVISVAAVNADCRPWAHSSRGSAVDIAAPGESVWRATIDEEETQVTGMGKGTTYGTATTGGVAALWVAKHKGTPAYERLKQRGLLTRALRWLMQETSWRPGETRVPAGVSCRAATVWDPTRFGAGILDARALLEADLPTPASLERALAASRERSGVESDDDARSAETIDELPLWGSLYPPATSSVTAASDYEALFSESAVAEQGLENLALFEAEILHHYATHESFSEAVDDVVLSGRRDTVALERVRQGLKSRALSRSLRSVLR